MGYLCYFLVRKLMINSLSIIFPVFNEQSRIKNSLNKIKRFIKFSKLKYIEVIFIDDGSTDNTYSIINNFILAFKNNKKIRLFLLKNSKNFGKGHAIKAVVKKARGDIILIQDADLEYDPKELLKFIPPLLNGSADAVFGSRFRSGEIGRVLYFWHSLGNKFLTTLSNMTTNLNLTDMETCYKVIRKDMLDSIDLKENRFGFEPEITAKLAKKGARIYEVGISYYGRTYEEGKKIGWKDGVRAIYCILKYGLVK